MDTRHDIGHAPDMIQIDKVLGLEERKGYRDDAASNGIARFVGERVARLLRIADADERGRIQDLEALLAEYSSVPAANRPAVIAEARRILGDLQRPPVAESSSPATEAQPRTSR
ncbi:MAG TPA: hypothetical protein DEG70_15195, partial [Chloroflexi bacterium]|nr:hypothetical protein [Chloroflexota bacterium]